jgi:hypothetical protein
MNVAQILALARPTLVNGIWRKPALSGRKLNQLKKVVLAEGGEWPSELEKARGTVVRRPPKGHKHERQAPEKLAEREKAMAAMDGKLEKMSQTLQEQRTAMRPKGVKALLS